MGPICYIFGAGEFSNQEVHVRPGDYVIAADAGYLHAQAAGLPVDMLLGDFDSLGEIPPHPNIRRYPSVKNETDTGLAIEAGLALRYNTFVIHGGLGGARIDHSYGNIQLVARLAKRGKRGYLAGDGFTISAVSGGSLSFDAHCRGMISVFCGGGRARGVTLEGLKYPLEGATLRPDMTLGVSNEFTGRESRVSVSQGVLIVMWQGAWTDVLK